MKSRGLDYLLLSKRVHQQRKVIISFIIKVILKKPNKNKTTSLIYFQCRFFQHFQQLSTFTKYCCSTIRGIFYSKLLKRWGNTRLWVNYFFIAVPVQSQAPFILSLCINLSNVATQENIRIRPLEVWS